MKNLLFRKKGEKEFKKKEIGLPEVAKVRSIFWSVKNLRLKRWKQKIENCVTYEGLANICRDMVQEHQDFKNYYEELKQQQNLP